MHRDITQQAIEVLGEIVIVDDRAWGRYIGRIIEVSHDIRGLTKAAVEILAVLKYPSQEALVNYSGIFHRMAYGPGETKDFDIAILMPYPGDMSTIKDYNSTLSEALDAIIAEYEAEYKIFKKLKQYAARKCAYLEDTIVFLKCQKNIMRGQNHDTTTE